jgi:hypothetical protein
MKHAMGGIITKENKHIISVDFPADQIIPLEKPLKVIPLNENSNIRHDIKLNIIKFRWYEKLVFKLRIKKVIRKLIRDMK